MRETLMEIIREVARENDVTSSLIVSSSRRRDVEKARWLAVREIVRRCPTVTPEAMADVFGLDERAARYRIAMGRNLLDRQEDPRPWPKTPSAILLDHVAPLPKSTQVALFSGVRKKAIVAIRWAIARDIYHGCPGVSPQDIARLLKVDRTSILYAIGRLPFKYPRTTSAPDNREQTRTKAA